MNWCLKSGKNNIWFTLAFVVLAWAGSVSSLIAREEKSVSPPVIRLYESERSLVLIPVLNDTGDEGLDYLSQGVYRMMLSKIHANSVKEESPELIFQSSPSGKPGAKNTAAAQHLPVYLSIADVDEEQSKLVKQKNYNALAIKEKADYLVAGNFYFSADDKNTIIVDLVFYNAIKNEIYPMQHKSEVEKIYDNLDGLSAKISSFFETGEEIDITIDAGNTSAMIYLNGAYIGRSPAKSRIETGSHSLTVEREGFKPLRRVIEVTQSGRRKFNIRLEDKTYHGQLSVTSDPPGAKVYLDMTYLGLTPLVASTLPPGTHRIRVSKDGMVDRFVGVELVEGTLIRKHVEMEEGDTLFVYRDPGYLLLDWTYDEMTLYSGITVLASYGSWGYWKMAANDKADSIREMIPAYSIIDVQNFGLYEFWLMKENEKKVQKLERKATYSAYAGAGAFGLALYFFYLGYMAEDREVGSVSFIFQAPVVQQTAKVGLTESYSSAGVVFRF